MNYLYYTAPSAVQSTLTEGNMDHSTSAPFGPMSHNVELYTARLFIQGSISGSFKRTSDLINRRDKDFFTVLNAGVTPLGQTSATASRVSTPVMVGRDHVQFVATAPQQTQGKSGGTASSPGREYYVQKTPHPCYALTDTFIIYGHCHLLSGTTLENLLTIPDPFIPLTKATIYLIARPNASWQRELVVVNKAKLEVIYLVE